MRILHYFLGFPPYRTGGLTKFAYDLMSSQSKKGDYVVALWPGRINIFDKSVKILKRKNVGKIENYEVVNPLPVPLDEGIQDVRLFIKSTEKKVFSDFLSSLNLDAIHIHTLMGLHKEFIEIANELNIKTVFTTHDYFGICPKVTMFRNGDVCDSAGSCADCTKCNENALSYQKIILMQSPIYKALKDSFLVKKIRQRHRSAFFEESADTWNKNDNIHKSNRRKYKILRKYYTDMLEMIDLIHFNSSVAEKVYKSFIKPKDSIVLTISNKEIEDNTSQIKYHSKKTRFTFLSPTKPFKGYFWLVQSLNRLWDEGNKNFELNLYTKVPESKPYMNINENGFTRDQLSEIFKNTDILVAPSIWYETFGFTVLEALSYGVPVIVSDRVGAKDIIGDCGVVVNVAERDSLYEVLRNAKNIRFSNNIKICKWDEYVLLNYKNYQ